MSYKYILGKDGRTVEPCEDVMKWATWFETANRQVANTDRDGVMVSTVFLGMDRDFSGTGPPLVFQTMIFDGAHDQEQWGYSTWDEAVTGHKAACEIARAKR